MEFIDSNSSIVQAGTLRSVKLNAVESKTLTTTGFSCGKVITNAMIVDGTITNANVQNFYSSTSNFTFSEFSVPIEVKQARFGNICVVSFKRTTNITVVANDIVKSNEQLNTVMRPPYKVHTYYPKYSFNPSDVVGNMYIDTDGYITLTPKQDDSFLFLNSSGSEISGFSISYVV